MDFTKRVLRNRAKPCEFDYPVANQTLADDMLLTMRRSRGIGLAAPQIGISRRLFVMDTGQGPRLCFNPEILASSDELIQMAEGCLSFPGESCTITRPRWVQVRYQDSQGTWTESRLSDLEARCFQHELDHLDGIVMQDRYKEQYAEQS